MLNSKKKPDIEVKRDGRVWLRGAAYARMKQKLGELAEWKCEKCGRSDRNGDVDHQQLRQMGGGKRDDRIFLPDGTRQLKYVCRKCHNGRHQATKVVPEKLSDSDFDRLIGL